MAERNLNGGNPEDSTVPATNEISADASDDQADLPFPPGLVAAAFAGLLVPFVGAGISRIAPSNLPTADELAASLVARGYGSIGDDLEAVAEACWVAGGWPLFARAVGFEEWRLRRPNACHVAIAELAAEGMVSIVLTTNWDICVERALVAADVAYSRVARAADVGVASNTSVHVMKLHGCIEVPEEIRARKSEVDDDTWAEDWAAVLFERVMRSNSLLFLGYSGASRAATKTIRRVVPTEGRPKADWVVGRRPRPTGLEGGRAADLLEALGGDAAAYVQRDPEDFFKELWRGLFPLMLAEIRRSARSLLESLLRDTNVPLDAVDPCLDTVFEVWSSIGRDQVLGVVRAAVAHCAVPYQPIRPIANELGRIWAWSALAIWCGVGSFNQDGRIRLGASERAVEVISLICASTDRRDASAQTITANRATLGPGAPGRSLAGVIVGGIGPLPQAPSTAYSVVRGIELPDIVRGATEISWMSIDLLFEQAVPDATVEQFKEKLTRTLDEAIRAVA